MIFRVNCKKESIIPIKRLVPSYNCSIAISIKKSSVRNVHPKVPHGKNSKCRSYSYSGAQYTSTRCLLKVAQKQIRAGWAQSGQYCTSVCMSMRRWPNKWYQSWAFRYGAGGCRRVCVGVPRVSSNLVIWWALVSKFLLMVFSCIEQRLP